MEQADRQTGRHADRQTYRQDHELSQADALIKSNRAAYITILWSHQNIEINRGKYL